jgi:hypothetical protein
MAKTFNPNRIGGGTFSLVQDAQGNYSIKETGFDPVKSLNMVDLLQIKQVLLQQIKLNKHFYYLKKMIKMMQIDRQIYLPVLQILVQDYKIHLIDLI